MKHFLTAVLLLSFVLPAAAQTECSLAVADLPEIHGLRLGTSRREVEKTYSITPSAVLIKSPGKQRAKNLEGLWFDFFQDSLANIEFDYDRQTEWKTVREFAAVLERTLKLPMDSWVFVDRTEAVMKCRDFSVSISSVRNTLSLTDTFAKTAAKQNGSSTTRTRIAGN